MTQISIEEIDEVEEEDEVDAKDAIDEAFVMQQRNAGPYGPAFKRYPTFNRIISRPRQGRSL